MNKAAAVVAIAGQIAVLNQQFAPVDQAAPVSPFNEQGVTGQGQAGAGADNQRIVQRPARLGGGERARTKLL